MNVKEKDKKSAIHPIEQSNKGKIKRKERFKNKEKLNIFVYNNMQVHIMCSSVLVQYLYSMIIFNFLIVNTTCSMFIVNLIEQNL